MRLAAAGQVMTEQLVPTVEAAAAGAVEAHLDAEYVPRRNALGGTPTGYWSRVRGSIQSSHDGDSATVAISGPGLRMKWEGGVIRPSGRTSTVTGKPIRFLSIPVDAQAHGKLPAMFGDRLYSRGFAGGTGAREGDTRGGMGLWLRTGDQSSDSDPLLFWLVKKVTVTADKNILPPAERIAAECGEAVGVLLDAAAQ